MKNSGARTRDADLGPGPATDLVEDAGLPHSRLRVLTALRELGRPGSLVELTRATGLHANTVREHLATLDRSGHVRRHRESPAGRGRPAWLYEPSPGARGGAAGGLGVREYAGLVASLVASLERSSPDPPADALEAGLAWGRELADRMGRPRRRTPSAGRHQVVALFAGLGFAPEADPAATSVRLTRCPLLDAARRHPDIVCNLHLGVARAALQTWGTPSDDTTLEPFSDPGFCRLRLAGPTRPRAAEHSLLG